MLWWISDGVAAERTLSGKFWSKKRYKEYLQNYINGLAFITSNMMTKSRNEGWLRGTGEARTWNDYGVRRFTQGVNGRDVMSVSWQSSAELLVY